MGWGQQRGGALVAPQLSKFAAERAKERASILKEQRKYAEEMRLKKSVGGSGGRKGGKGGNAAGDGSAGAQ